MNLLKSQGKKLNIQKKEWFYPREYFIGRWKWICKIVPVKQMSQINFQDKTWLQSYAICTVFNSLLLDGFFIWFKLFYHPTSLKQHWVWKTEMQEKLLVTQWVGVEVEWWCFNRTVKGWQMYKGKFLNMLETKPIKLPNLMISCLIAQSGICYTNGSVLPRCIRVRTLVLVEAHSWNHHI